MKAMPSALAVKMLETDPIPSVERMVSFAQRYRALHALPTGTSADLATCAVQACPTPQLPARPSSAEFDALLNLHQQQQDRFTKVEAIVSSLSDSYAHLVAAITPQRKVQNRPQVGKGIAAPIECFRYHQLGHIARNCAFPPTPRWLQQSASVQCSLCFGWGHLRRDCANNNVASPIRKSVNSLNFQGVPRY